MKQKMIPGLVFAVPLPGGGYAYGKLLFHAPRLDIAKIYDLYTVEVGDLTTVVASPVLAERLYIAGSGIRSGDWPAIGSEELKEGEDPTEESYLLGLPPTQQVRRIKDNSLVGKPSEHDLRTLPRSVFHHQFHFQDMLLKR